MDIQKDLDSSKLELNHSSKNALDNCEVFWDCESYEEYKLNCDLRGIKSIFSQEKFEQLKSPFEIVDDL